MAMNYDGIPGEYEYSKAELGKSAKGVAKYGAQSERSASAQKNAGGIDRQMGDHGGHLIAHCLGGRNDATNLDAQAANVNQRDQAAVERNICSLLQNENNTVCLEVYNYHTTGERPTATMMNIGLRNDITGVIEQQHISFQNESHEVQQEWNNIVDQVDQEIDPRQDIGLTPEERALANELCGEEDTIDMRLGTGCTYREFDISFLEETTNQESEESEILVENNLGEESESKEAESSIEEIANQESEESEALIENSSSEESESSIENNSGGENEEAESLAGNEEIDDSDGLSE